MGSVVDASIAHVVFMSKLSSSEGLTNMYTYQIVYKYG